MSATIDFLCSAATYSAIVIGPGGSGKTSFVWSMLDNILPDEPIMLYGYPEDVLDYVPPRIRSRALTFSEWSEVAMLEGSIVYDDSLLSTGARSYNSKSSKDAQANMSIARHHGWRVWWTVQNTSLLDKLAWQSLDTIMFHKLMSPSTIWTEREELIECQLLANESISEVVDRTGADPRSLIYCSTFDEVLQVPLVSWWGDAVSKPYRRCYVHDGQIIRV